MNYSRAVGIKELLVTPPGGGYNNESTVQQNGEEGLSPYSPQTPQSGLKSPDSGVNVSILE